jgi:hypothetical protein
VDKWPRKGGHGIVWVGAKWTNPRHPTKLPALTETLRLPGKRLVVAVEQAA